MINLRKNNEKSTPSSQKKKNKSRISHSRCGQTVTIVCVCGGGGVQRIWPINLPFSDGVFYVPPPTPKPKEKPSYSAIIITSN